MVYTPLQVIFSQNLNLLASSLAEEIERSQKARLLQKLWIFVPNHSLKQWLLVQLARFRSSGGIAGCKICTLDEMLRFRFKQIPTQIEMRCLIYQELSKERSPEVTAFLERSSRSKLELSHHLAEKFFSYGQHGLPSQIDADDWQVTLFNELFVKNKYRLPMHILPDAVPLNDDPVYCFGFNFIPEIYWQFLSRFPSCFIYLFSPCVHFWEDVCTDKEQRSLSNYWKKQGVSLGSLEQAQHYFSEAPPLLANLGKLGRENLKLLDNFPFESESLHASMDTQTVLRSLQSEILFFEKMPLSEIAPDGSIQVFLTGASKLREVEVLQEEICRLVQERHFQFGEILVLSPEIESYVPLIEYVFSKESIPYRFPSISLGAQSPFSQGLSRLISLISGSWGCEKLISLFEAPAFFQRQEIESKERVCWIDWVKEIFQNSVDWETGFSQLLQESISIYPGPKVDRISLGEFDLLEKLFLLLQSLQTDLADLGKRSLSLSAWADLWQEIAAKYLYCNFEDEIDSSAWGSFCSLLKNLREADLQNTLYPFEVIEDFIGESSPGSIHGNHLHAVRCDSLKEGSVVPAKAIFLVGMDEESFPRKKTFSSLDLLKKQSKYVPDRSDIDRYVFLQALMSAQETLCISYGHLSQEDGKPMGPSLVVQELLSTLGSSVIQTTVQRPVPNGTISPRFFLRCPSSAVSNNALIPLSDLSLFARHPWKYYLQKHLRIYLEDRSDLSFAVQRAILLRSCVKWPLETVFSSQHERLPGPFNKAFFLDVEEKQREREQQFKSWGKNVRSISFLETAVAKKVLLDGSYEFPPLGVDLDDGSTYRLIGDVPFAMEDGILHLGDDKLPSLLKIWPEALAASIALQSSHIYFLKTGKVKSISDPKSALKKFIEYYVRCNQGLSPLVPDWSDAFLRKTFEEFSYEFDYEDVVNQWIHARLELPEPKALFEEWSWLRDSFRGLVDLYPTRGKKEIDETV